jgi:hypothetical protein
MARRHPVRIAGLAMSLAVIVAVACESPTEVTLVLTTDVPCSALDGTTITVGAADEIESKAPVAETVDCSSSSSGLNNIGTFVVVPSGSRSASFEVRIVSGVAQQARNCARGNQAPNYTGCIVARRELAFIPHTPLILPIAMRMDCENVRCATDETCVEGECVSDMISDPARCAGAGCSEGELLEAGPPAGASDAESAADVVVSEVSAGDVTSMDATRGDSAPLDSSPSGPPPEDATLDARSLDAPSSDATATDGPSPDAPALDAAIDAPAPDASLDAPSADAAPQESGPPVEASMPPQDASGPGDGSPLGSCVDAGTSGGVGCGGQTCASGEVCCVGVPSSGPTTYMCTNTAGCDTTTSGGTTYSSLACRNIGDCPSGEVCCVSAPGAVGDGYSTVCTASCPNSFNKAQSCRSTCECATSTCELAQAGCAALDLATCGGTCP